MTAMTEAVENTVLIGQPELQESDAAAEKDQTSLIEAFENTLDISQNVETSKSSDCREKAEQKDGQAEGQTVPPPEAESSSPETRWEVGAPCRAVWSEDGRVYPAIVVAVDGGCCRVRFDRYGNQEDVELSSLRSPDAASQTQRQNSSQEDWKPGSRCRAVYSEDGLVYPAVVLWVKGQRCRVRFDNYNNEEEQDVSSLLHPNELHGPSRGPAAKGSWKSSTTSSNLDWKRRRREENQGEQGGGAERGSVRREEEQNFYWLKEKASNQSKYEREVEEKKRGNQRRDDAEKPTNHSFSFFPPFPPPPQSGSVEPPSLVPPPPPPPPPPPLWAFGGAAGVDASSSMLMLWYMCGFHTGSYMAQQGFRSHSKD